MLRTLIFVVMASSTIVCIGQVCTRAQVIAEGEEGAGITRAEAQARRANLREMLRAQAQTVGPIDPRRLSYTERAQMRLLLIQQRRETLSSAP